MCRTAHAVLSVAICGIQMLVRVFMTFILMMENVFRLVLQTLYNFISFLLQMLSLIPICVVFLATTRLKCFMCGGGGPCPVNRGGGCDCLMSAAAIILLFFIFRAVGVLDKMFYKIGYVAAPPMVVEKFLPTPGSITECSRDDRTIYKSTETETEHDRTNEMTTTSSNLRAETEIYYMQDTETEVVTEISKMSTTLAHVELKNTKSNIQTDIFTVDAHTTDTSKYVTEVYYKDVETERLETEITVTFRSKQRREIRKKKLPRKTTQSGKVETPTIPMTPLIELQTVDDPIKTTNLEEIVSLTTVTIISPIVGTHTELETSSIIVPSKSTLDAKDGTKALLDILKYSTT